MKKERFENRYSMKAIVQIIEEYTSRSKEVIFTAKGNSMRPLLRNGKDQLILRGYNGEELPMGTVVLYQRADMSFSAHRIVGKNDKGCGGWFYKKWSGVFCSKQAVSLLCSVLDEIEGY